MNLFKLRLSLLALLLLIAASSCKKVGPDFVPPLAPYKADWIEGKRDDIDTSGELITDWWSLFNDPLLDYFTAVARQQNLPLRIALYRILEARALLGIAIGEFFPQLQEAFGDATRTQLSKFEPRFVPGTQRIFKDYRLGFRAAWELDIWGKFRRAIESEAASLDASIANYDDILVLLQADVAAAYATIRSTQELIEIIKQNVTLQERSVQITSAQYKGGFVSELDVQQATVLLKNTEARLPELETQLRLAQNALCVLLGIPANDIHDLFTDNQKTPIPPETILVPIPESLLFRRPDIRRAYYEAASQSARIGVAVADFFPQISLTGTIGYNSRGNFPAILGGNGSLFDRDSLTFSYGSQFNWPILNYGRITNRVRAQHAIFLQTAVNYQNTVLEAYREIEDALIGFINSKERVRIFQESVQASERSVDLARRQYVEGMVDFTRVLDTTRSLLDDEESHVRAKLETVLSVIDAYKALGGGWEIRCSE